MADRSPCVLFNVMGKASLAAVTTRDQRHEKTIRNIASTHGEVADIDRGTTPHGPAREIHVEPLTKNRADAEHQERDRRAWRQNPPRDQPGGKIVQNESTCDERDQHC
jgi:hypothetical protein